VELDGLGARHGASPGDVRRLAESLTPAMTALPLCRRCNEIELRRAPPASPMRQTPSPCIQTSQPGRKYASAGDGGVYSYPPAWSRDCHVGPGKTLVLEQFCMILKHCMYLAE